MTKQELLIMSAAIVTTLAETNGSPESMLYIFCDMNMDKWQTIRSILVQAGMIQIKGNYVTLTESGKSVADKLNQKLSK